MRGRPRQACLWLALVLTLIQGETSQAAVGKAVVSQRELVAALRSQPVVLAVWNGTPAKPTDETYGDWADALNNFHSSAQVKVITLTSREYRIAIAGPRLSGQFATLFIRDLDHALLYRGMILEPQVYQLGQSYMLEQSEPSPSSAYGLRPTTIRLRRGRTGSRVKCP